MKKITSCLITLFILVIFLIPILSVNAGPLSDARENLLKVASPLGFDKNSADIPTVVGGIISAILGTLGIVFMILTIYGGWLWMTAAGNQERVTRAKDLLRSAILGLIVILTAYAITKFVITVISTSSESIGTV